MIIKKMRMSAACAVFILGSSLAYAQTPPDLRVSGAPSDAGVPDGGVKQVLRETPPCTCKTAKECTDLNNAEGKRCLRQLQEGPLTWSEIVKKDASKKCATNEGDSEEQACKMTQVDAQDYCINHEKMRLPTARELALWTKNHGAELTTEKTAGSYPIPGNVPAMPSFHSRKNYKQPPNDWGKYTIWSSSPALVGTGDPKKDVYVLNGKFGVIASTVRDYPRAFRCVIGQSQ